MPFTKKAMITGATSGIGKATATLYAKRGYDIIITGRRTDRLQELRQKLKRKYAVRVKALNFDIRNKEATKKAFKSLDKSWKKIDILINNAGLAKGLAPIHKGNTEDWDQMIDTNVKGLLYISRLVTPGMVKRKKGHIINVCSTAGHEVYPNGNVYCASKHAVEALTRSMRIDLHKHGIRVSQVSPGHVEQTEFALVRYNGDKNKAKIYEDFTPLNSKDVADVIYFISTRPSHVSVQDIILMGTQQANSLHINRSGRKEVKK